jgi:hypothetical protein
MTQTLIRYLADAQNPLPESLRTYVETHGFGWQPWQADEGPGAILFLFSPCWNGAQYLSVEGVWARFLAEEYPDTILVVVGSKGCEDANYIDVLLPPDSLRAFLEQAPTARRFLHDQPVNTGALDLQERLFRFLNGHGDESILSITGNMLGDLRSIRLNLQKKAPEQSTLDGVLSYLQSEKMQFQWQTVVNRWMNYQPFFQYLPFSTIFVFVSTLIETLHELFKPQEIMDAGAWLAQTIPLLEQLDKNLESLLLYAKI